MKGTSLLLALVILAVVWGIQALFRRSKMATVLATFQRAGSRDARLVGSDTVLGSIRGRTYEYSISQGRRQFAGSTTLSTPLSKDAPLLEMHLYQQMQTAARSGVVDLEIGDAEFDRRVVVEAAPASTAVALLDSPISKRVLAVMPCTVTIADGELSVRKLGQVLEPASADALLDLLVALDLRLGAVKAPITEGSSEYRSPSPKPIDPERRAREKNEREELAAMRASRARRSQPQIAFYICAAIILGLMILRVFRR